MPDQSFDIALFLIFFIYGLAFWGMGLTLALESGRLASSAEKRVLRPLALFGMIHGSHEWLESYLLQAQVTGIIVPDWLAWARSGILIASFFCLLIYGIRAFQQPTYLPSIWRRFFLGVAFLYGVVILLSTLFLGQIANFRVLDLLDVFSRYLIAVPGAFLASLALLFQSRKSKEYAKSKLNSYLRTASVGFGIYALTQLVVHPLDFGPAVVLNTDTFRLLTGIPIQALRASVALLITIGLFQATHLAEVERQNQLTEAQNQQLKAMELVQEEMSKKEILRRELLRHVVQAQEEERARIARELHDETAQTLAAFSLDLATMQALVPEKPECRQLNARLQAHCKEISQGLYRIVHDLRPAQLDDMGLVPALQFLVDQTSENNSVDLQLEIIGDVRRIDTLIETVLFRVSQEAITNFIRHAKGKQASIRLEYRRQEILLSIKDQGVGFNPEQEFIPPRGWGIAGMRERIEAVGGRLIITSSPGEGTCVNVSIHVFDIIP